MAILTALFDACVLFPPSLRDLLMQLTLTGLFQARWTEEINDEWIESALKTPTPGTTRDKLERTRRLMSVVSMEKNCLVTDYLDLIPSLQMPDPNDRHVLAAAIRSHSDVIVTKNLKHFPSDVLKGYGIMAEHPDTFLTRIINLNPGVVCVTVKMCRERKRNPPKTVEQYLADLENTELPKTVVLLRQFANLI